MHSSTYCYKMLFKTLTKSFLSIHTENQEMSKMATFLAIVSLFTAVTT